MARLQANVVRVDRDRQRAEVMPVGMNRPIAAVYLDSKRPPPPLASVFIEQVGSGQWVVRDAISVRELVFHDDFTSVLDNPPGSTAVLGDTLWTQVGALAAGFSTQDSVTFGGSGVVAITTGAGVALASNTLFKDDLALNLEAEKAYWLSCRIAPRAPTDATHAVGFSDFALTNFAVINIATATLTLVTAGPTLLTIPRPSGASFLLIDIVLLPGVGVAVWVDGDGPYWQTVGVPVAAAQVSARLAAQTISGTTRALYVDWAHLEAFTSPTQPDRLYDIGAWGATRAP